jgi:hypothetical protein
METQSVVIGEIVLDPTSAPLRVETSEPLSTARIALLKYKLAFLLDSRFRPAAPEPSDEMTLDEVLALWKCRRVTVLRRMKAGELHAIERDGQMRFDRTEIERLVRAP